MKKEKTEAWHKVANTVKDYSDELVEQWIKQIDGLLTFVSSFELCARLHVYSPIYPMTGRSFLGDSDRL